MNLDELRRWERRRYGLAHYPPDDRAPGHRVVWVKRHPAPSNGPWPMLLSWRCACGLNDFLLPPEASREAWSCHVLVALDGRHGGPDAPPDRHHPGRGDPIMGLRPPAVVS